MSPVRGTSTRREATMPCPGAITHTSSPSSNASSTSCVTRMIPMPIRACKVTSSNCICSRVMASRAANGSSMSSTGGDRANTRASETRCFWPPESSAGMILPTGKPGQCQHVESPRTPSGGWDTRGLKSDLHVFQRRQPREQRGLLKHYRPIRAGATARPAFQRHCARVGRIEPGEDIQQRRLATSRSPDQGQYATTGNSNRYARQYKP